MPTHEGNCPGLAVLDCTTVITMNSMLGLREGTRYTHLPVVMAITIYPHQSCRLIAGTAWDTSELIFQDCLHTPARQPWLCANCSDFIIIIGWGLHPRVRFC